MIKNLFLYIDNLLPNVIVELYFLVQLLTARGGGVEETFIYGDGNIFLYSVMIIVGGHIKFSLHVLTLLAQ